MGPEAVSSPGEAMRCKQTQGGDQAMEALRERLSRLSEASLRINESLDFETVLQGVLDSARSLTGARYGVITLLDDAGRIQDFLYSGLTAEQHRRFMDFPDGMPFFEYLSSISEPLRLAGLPQLHEVAGPARVPPALSGEFPPALSGRAHPAPGRGHRGHLRGRKGDQEFTAEDEETLVMFASQAALVIANARRHREEQRARADLEALVNTAPVGVMVFDAKTGNPLSVNREARRIVSGLCEPGGSAEQLLEVLTFRRADGREVSLGEFPLAQGLMTGETVRAEEIVLKAPDGRSVTTLVNSTPIFSEDGEVESVVVTVQDMTPMEELERLRAEFLGMVSHELQAPLTSIKGSAATLLESLNSLDPAVMVQFLRIIESQANRMRELIFDLLDVARIEAGTLSVSPEPVEVAALVDEARNAFLSGGGRDNLAIDLEPDLPWVMVDRRRIVQVLGNLLSNAARYSHETSAIRVRAGRDDGVVAVSVADEGRGVPADLLPFLFRKFSRIDGDDGEQEIAGSGLGLAICKGIVEAHGGRIRAESAGPGLGSRFTFTLPVADPAPAREAHRSSGGPRQHEGEPAGILAVDDDPQSIRYVRDILAQAGYAPMVTGDPEEAIRLVEVNRPSLVLMDLMLPGSDGIELMERILGIAEVPVIFLSAYGRDETIARAFEAGAADYVVKPFSPTELVARVRAAMRRRMAPVQVEPSRPFVLADLTINYAERGVSVAGRLVRLTANEYGLLFELSVNAGRVLTHDDLLQRVWGLDHSGDRGTVRSCVKRLRRKLGEDANNPVYIFAEPRVGYRMAKGETPGQVEPSP